MIIWSWSAWILWIVGRLTIRFSNTMCILRKEILNECYNLKWSERFGGLKCVKTSHYLWILMVCASKIILKPLSILEKPWENICIDFIIWLPKSKWCRNIMVIVTVSQSTPRSHYAALDMLLSDKPAYRSLGLKNNPNTNNINMLSSKLSHTSIQAS